MGYMINMLVMMTMIVGNLPQQIYYTAPKYIDVTLNTDVYPSNQVSYLQVYGPHESEVSIGDCTFVGKRTMRIRIMDDGPGTYTVLWHVLADDMLEHQGVTNFVVYQISYFFILFCCLIACVLLSLSFFVWRFTHAYHRK